MMKQSQAIRLRNRIMMNTSGGVKRTKPFPSLWKRLWFFLTIFFLISMWLVSGKLREARSRRDRRQKFASKCSRSTRFTHFCTAPPSQIMQIAFILFAALVRKFNKCDVEVFGISALLYGEGHNLPDSSQIYAHFATTFF